MPNSRIYIESNGGRVDIRVTHKEAKRLIEEYELPSSGSADDFNDGYGSWGKDGPNYVIHIHA